MSIMSASTLRALGRLGGCAPLREGFAFSRGIAGKDLGDKFAVPDAAAAGGSQEEGSVPTETEVPDSALPPIGGYGEDPLAVAVTSAGEALSEAGEAAQQGAASGGEREAAEEAAPEARGSQASEEGNVPARGEAPGTSGHALPGALRWKKEAADAMQGGTPEPGVVLE